MPFDGSGNYTPAASPNFPAIGGTTISAAYYNAVINDIASALSNTLTRDGQGRPSVDINWNAKSLTNVNNLGAVSGAFTGNVSVGGTLSAPTLDLASPLPVTEGGTGAATPAAARAALGAGTGDGTVTSVNISGGSTGLTATGGPIIGSGTITLGGTLAVANGGTGTTSSTGTGAVVLQSNATLGGVTLSANAVGGTAGNTSVPVLTSSLAGSNDLRNFLVNERVTAGSDWTTTRTRLVARVDTTDQTYIDLRTDTSAPGIAFGTGAAGSPVERMRITAGGNVGIGTNDPQSQLHVQTSAVSSLGIQVRQLSTNQFSPAGVLCRGPVGSGLQGGTGFYHLNLNTGGTQGAMSIAQYDENGSFQRALCDYNYNTQTWAFYTNAQSRLTIDGSGAITSANRADAVGYKGLPQNPKTASYTLDLSDIGKHISITTGGVVIPANSSVAFPKGSAIGIYNDSAATQTISITTDTLRLVGTATTGTRTLAARGFCTLVKVNDTEWVAMGSVA